MKNLKYYDAFKTVPDEAKKKITAGRLAGKTDINPMWRIKKLTEMFGPCGLGWYLEIVRMWIEEGVNNEYIASVEIKLFVKFGDEWSKPIPGIGGSMFVAKENKGLYVDDDCYKKAYTDAISVACKALGIAADVYYEKDPDSKYTIESKNTPTQTAADISGNAEKAAAEKSAKIRETRLAEISKLMKEHGLDQEDLKALKEQYGIVRIEETAPVIYKRLIEAISKWNS